MFFVEYLGEVMITQVGGRIGSGVARDPRRKAQSVQFKNSTYIPYKGSNESIYREQEKKALRTSALIVAGSILFMVSYFLISALSSKKIKAVA